MDLSSLITIATIVFSMLKITRGLKIFEKLAPDPSYIDGACIIACLQWPSPIVTVVPNWSEKNETAHCRQHWPKGRPEYWCCAAIPQYRNTPNPDVKISPAMCVFGLPHSQFRPCYAREAPPAWDLAWNTESPRNRLHKSHIRIADKLTEYIKRLPPLVVSDFGRIQNQMGPYPANGTELAA